MTLRPVFLVSVLLSLVACEDPPPSPSSSPSSPSAPVPVPSTGTPAAARVIGDERCPAGQFFVHGGCHTGDSVGVAGPAPPSSPSPMQATP